MQRDPFGAPILCPVDFSELSAGALRLATWAGERCASPVTVLHAAWFEAPPYFTPDRAGRIAAQLRDSLDDARSALERFAGQTVPGAKLAIRVEEGDPRVVVPRLAHALDAGLIVMGTHGRTGIDRFRLGSVAEDLLHASDVPLLTVRPRDRFEAVASMVCAVNDSEVSRRALWYAARLSQCLGARLSVVHVLDGRGPRAIPDLCAWVGQSDRRDCEIQEVTRQGHAAEEIIRMVSETKAGILVIGAEHKLFADKTVIGATTVRVVHHSPCPVLTVAGGTLPNVISSQIK